MRSSAQLYGDSLELEELVKEYSKEENYRKLEKTLIKLIKVYKNLNVHEEDDYLEDLISTYAKLADVYLNKEKYDDAVMVYEKIIDNYDTLLQIDKNKKELMKKHISNLKDTYFELKQLYKKLNIRDKIKSEYPRIKEYLD